jgi:hypothetical protein
MKSRHGKRYLAAVGAAAFLLAAPVAANALSFPGTRLVELMREYEKSETGSADVLWGNVGRFEGYVLGVSDAMDSVILLDGATPAHITAAVAKYLNSNPARWSQSSFDLVKQALLEAFPRR